eukprot:COSAG05_NODE_3693_length_1902_cov_1.190793_1_plen_153_part_10
MTTSLQQSDWAIQHMNQVISSLEEPYDSAEETEALAEDQETQQSIRDLVETMVTKIECDVELQKMNDRKRRLLQFRTDTLSPNSPYQQKLKEASLATNSAQQYSDIMENLIQREHELRCENKRLRRLLWPKNGMILDELIQMEGRHINRVLRV